MNGTTFLRLFRGRMALALFFTALTGCSFSPPQPKTNADSPAAARSATPASVQESKKPRPAQDRPVDSDDTERHPSRWKRKLKAKYA